MRRRCQAAVLKGGKDGVTARPCGRWHRTGKVCWQHRSRPWIWFFRPDRCARIVRRAPTLKWRQCGRKRGYGPGGRFCWQHQHD